VDQTPRNHLPTLAAIGALAYVIAVALHEHLGHAAACIALGSRPDELGAFYIQCHDAGLSSLGIRGVAIAGPVASLLLGIIAFALLPKKPERAEGWLFVWLLGTLGLMTGTGYMMFSGIVGIGDLGVGDDAALHGLDHAGIYRIVLAVIGGATYYASARYAVKRIEPFVPGAGNARVAAGRKLFMVIYVTGALVYLAIGALNPYGLLIVVTSSMASSLGGTSGFLWMMETADRKSPANTEPPLVVRARPGWIVAAIALCGLYSATFGPTIRP